MYDKAYCIECEELIVDYDGTHVPVCDDCMEEYLDNKEMEQE